MRQLYRLSVIALTLALTLIGGIVRAQPPPVPVECGVTIEGELKDKDDLHSYGLILVPGDAVTIQTIPVGSAVDIAFALYDPSGTRIADLDGQPLYGSSRDWGEGVGLSDSLRDFVVSARGEHLIYVNAKTAGAYSLLVGCKLRDGTIKDATSGETTTNSINESPITAFSGIGFPGLSPVDFSDIPKIPMIAGAPMAGAIASSETLGFTFDANTGDTVDLTFTRLSGNLNLGLVVLSADNKVAFQASLVTSSALNTRFTLPSAGTYTIGVFRIDLLPPAVPEATAFQVQAVVNP